MIRLPASYLLSWLKVPAVRIYLIYGALTTILLYPLFLTRGYIFALDMVFTPVLRMPDAINNTFVFYTLLHVLDYLLPSDLIQKAMLAIIFFLAGTGMHRLVAYLERNTSEKTQSYRPVGRYMAGIFYAVNPFTYDRLMAGQYEVLLGYALLPFFGKAFLMFLARPALKTGLFTGAWVAGISMLSIHSLGLMALMAGLGLILAAYQHRTDRVYKAHLGRYGVAAVVLFVAISSYWLVPLLLGHGSTANQLAEFSVKDTAAFATLGDSPVEKIANVLRLQGFWQESRGWYILPGEMMGIWNVLWLLIFAGILTGIVAAWRAGQRFALLLFGLTSLAATVLAAGMGLIGLIGHVSFLSGFREPQKFAALIALFYALSLGWGIPVVLRALQTETSRRMARFASFAVILLPFMLTPTLVNGARGQLSAQAYPAGWYTANRLLNRDQEDFRMLFLPWHLYMQYAFAGKIIASPAPSFFDKPTIVSDDPEFNGAGAAGPSAAKQAVARIMASDPAGDPNFAKRLAEQNIKYVLLSRDNDYRTYNYLNQKPGLKRIYHSGTIDVYQNKAYKEMTL